MHKCHKVKFEQAGSMKLKVFQQALGDFNQNADNTEVREKELRQIPLVLYKLRNTIRRAEGRNLTKRDGNKP